MKQKSLRQDIIELKIKLGKKDLLIEDQDKLIVQQADRIKTLEQKIENLKAELNQKTPAETLEPKIHSQNIAGWTVSKCPDGYYRAYKTINKKSYSLYVGKRITKTVKTKIIKKEKEIKNAMVVGQ